MTHQSICAHCGAQFTRPSRQECCSRHCAAKLQMEQQNIAWTPETDQWLRALSPALPLDDLVAAYRKEAAVRGWPPRSRDAIRKHANRLGAFRRRDKPVINLTTGVEYPSSNAAARACWVTPSAIRNAARWGTESADCRWAYVQDLEEQRQA